MVAVVLLLHVAEDTVINLYWDFVESFHNGYEHCRRILNADVYGERFMLSSTERITFRTYWMPSHLLEDPEMSRKKSKNPMPTPGWVEMWHKLGNNHADVLAADACKRFDLNSRVADPIIERAQQVKIIQKRIASIICHLPSLPKH